MLRLGAEAWELIDIPDLTPQCSPIFAQIDSENICILGGDVEEGTETSDTSKGVILNAKTSAVVRLINLDNIFACGSQSYMKCPGQILSLVNTDCAEVQLICYN